MEKAINKILNTKPKLLVGFVLSLIMFYTFGSFAINTGSYWHYSAALVCLWLSVKLIIKTTKRHGKKTTAR
jgi:uncharacterized protein (DUF486 family)